MNSTGSALRSCITSPRRLPILLVLLALACAPLAAQAGEDGWHLEAGFGGRSVLALSKQYDAVGPGGGSEADLHIVKSSGGLGARFEGGDFGLRTRTVQLLAIQPFSVDMGPVPLPVDLEQRTTWGAFGPTWCFPLRWGRMEAYVLGGYVQTVTEVRPPETDNGYFSWSNSWPYGLPKGGESDLSPLYIVGGSWSGGRVRLWRFAFGYEVGVELQTTGRTRVLDDPPVQLEGGQYVTRTRSITMSGAALRLGFNFLGRSRKG